MRASALWRAATFAAAALFALAIAGDLIWMPIQVGDSLGEMLDAQETPSIRAAFTRSLGTDAYLRPARIAQIKALFDAAGGEHYQLTYRGVHAALLIAALMLFAGALRVSTAGDFGAAAVALTVLVGLHTFRGTLQEAFPINHFLEMVVAALIVLNLARARPALWKDACAGLTLAVAVLTLESGLLVWVVAVTAWTIGWRGIALRGVMAMTIVALGYLSLRFFYLDTGVPSLAERSSGYLFEMLDPPALQARFGDRPAVFYAYNVAASALSVLFSEPRVGVFAATAGLLEGHVPLRLALWVATSCGMTALIVWAAGRRLRSYLQAPREGAPHVSRLSDDGSRMLVLFAVVLAANAVLSFAYTKDEIISVAGVFYALAAWVAMRDALLALAGGPAGPPRRPGLGRVAAAVVLVLLVALSAAWSLRAVGVHYLLRSQAIKHQNDWAYLPHVWRRDGRWPERDDARRLILQLRREAVGLRLPNTRTGQPEWADRIWTD